MSYTILSDDIYQARKMAEQPQAHSRKEIANTIDSLDSAELSLWGFIGALGEIMVYTADNRDAWRKESLLHIGEGLASITDIACGLWETKNSLLQSLSKLDAKG
mgnify:CR=1 FL=1